MPSTSIHVLRQIHIHQIMPRRSHECDAAGTAALPVVTEGKLAGIDAPHDACAAAAACAAACQELALWGPPGSRHDSSFVLLQHGLCAHRVQLERLKALRPDVILTSLQGAPSDAHDADKYALAYSQALEVRPSFVIMPELHDDMQHWHTNRELRY